MAKRKFDDTNFSTNEDQKISYLTLDDRTCTRCGTVTNKIDSNIKEFNWAKQLQCPKCNEIWTICVVCTYRGGRMKNLRSVLSHHYYCHNVKNTNDIKESECAMIPSFDNDSDINETIVSNIDTRQTYHIQHPLLCKLLEDSSNKITFENCQSQKNKEFFENLTKNTHVKSLIPSSITSNGNQETNLNEIEKSLHINYCSLAYKLPPNDRHILASLITNVIAHTTRKNEEVTQKSPNDIATATTVTSRIPTNTNEIRKYYLDNMVDNLPAPDIVNHGQHAFVRFKDLLTYVLALGVDCIPITPNDKSLNSIQKIEECKVSQDFLNKEIEENNGEMQTWNIIITDWHDDFEPNTQAKQNRGSVWIHSVTFVGPSNTRNKAKYSYPLAFGNKSTNHDYVIAQLKEDVEEINQSNMCFFHRGVNKMIFVKVLHLLSIADSPERRSKNYVTLGNGEYSGRWGYKCNVNEIAHKLPHCDSCLQRSVSNTLSEHLNNNCNRCVQWNFETKKIHLLTYPLPKKHPDHPKNDIPSKLTYEGLTMLLRKTIFQCYKSEITLQEGITKLKCNGINEELIGKFKDGFQKRIEGKTLDVTQLKTAINDIVPKQWMKQSGAINERYIDAIMHLVFYGIGGSTVQEVTNYLKMKKKHASFKDKVNCITKEIEDLRLDWCKLMSYKEGSFGGWIAENWIAYLRISKWVYGILDILIDDKEYCPPDKAVTRWTKAENIEWLKARGLTHVGNANDLKQLVKSYMNQPEEAPPILLPRGGHVNNAINLVRSMATMVSLIMTDHTSPNLITKVDHSIRIYLTMAHRFEINQEKDKSRKYNWVSKSNYLSLLNLPRQMELYGPLRLYWEGGYRGEGLIQDIKGIINHGLTSGWQRNTLKKFYNNRSLSFLAEEHNCKIDSNYLSYDIDRNYKRYGKVDSIAEQFHKHLPLSIIYSKTGVYYVAIDKRESLQVLRNTFTHSHGGLDFYIWKLLETDALPTPTKIEIQCYCLLLPKIDNDQLDINVESNSRVYACINSDWKEHVKNKGFSTPRNISSEDI